MSERSNQKFDKIVEQLRGNDVSKAQGQETRNDEQEPNEIKTETESGYKEYDKPANVRKLCLVWQNGEKEFFDYAYLYRGKLNLNGELNSIILRFGSDMITLKGYSLDSLYEKLCLHLPSVIKQFDTRYISTTLSVDDNKLPTVLEIDVTQMEGEKP